MRTREQIITAIHARRAIYVRKAREAARRGDDDRHERMTHTAEVFEILLGDIGA